MKVRNLVFLIAVLAMLVPCFVSAQEPTEEWVKRYANGQATAMAVDSLGNVYVTGLSSASGKQSYVTIKYDTHGNELWVRDYNSGLYASPVAIAADSYGNVYVTGMQVFEGGAYGSGIQTIATVKYDSSGSLVWSKIFSGIGTGPCMGWNSPYATPKSIVIDGGGNVIVIGGTSVHLGYEALLAIKYDPSGNEIWSNTYRISVSAPYEGCSSTFAVAGTVDAFGNTYVIGHGGACPLGYCSTPISSDLVTVKFDINGNLDWVSRYDFENKEESASDITVDSASNVYITGNSGNDYATVKYDSNGNQQWVARYSASENSNDNAAGLFVNSYGNVYVTGSSYTGWDYGTMDYATIKYDTNGNELWAKRYNSPSNYADSAVAITGDASGNIYVTGSATKEFFWDTDYATVKYDAIGNEVWIKSYAGPMGGDKACCINVDTSSNVYVTGASVGATNFDVATVKYSQPQQFIDVQIDIKPGSFPNSIKLQDTGNIPVAIFSTISFDAYNIEVSSLELNGAGVRIVKGKGYQYSFEDVNGDGLLDLVVHFDRGDAQLTVGDTFATVTGKTMDGTAIKGTDSVKVIE